MKGTTMDDDTDLTIINPGREPVKTSVGALGQLADRLKDLRDGEDLGYDDEATLNLARVSRMKAGYTFSASHTGNAKLTTDNEGRRVLTVAFRITSRRKDFPQVAGRIMELLADVSKDDEVSVTVMPVIQQMPLL